MPRDDIVLLGDRVELDCATNSSHPADWCFNRYGNNDKEFLVVNGQALANISDAYRIVNKDFGQIALVIDPVSTTLAGRYTCHDRYAAYERAVEVTVLGKDIFRSVIIAIDSLLLLMILG